MQVVCQWFFLFILYSVIGWVMETVLCSIIQREFAQRGFLNGPLCPIYGFGALFVLWLLHPFAGSILHVFFLGMIITTVLEYLTSYVMEKLFHMRWWDYSQFKIQINGRVCLVNSLLFGLLSVVLMEYLHPMLLRLVGLFSPAALVAVSGILFLAFAADTVLSVSAALKLSERLQNLRDLEEELKLRVKADLEEKKREVGQRIAGQHAEFGEKKKAMEEKLARKGERLEGLLREKREQSKRSAAELRDRIHALQAAQGFGERRLLRSFPHMKSASYDEAIGKLKDYQEKARKK